MAPYTSRALKQDDQAVERDADKKNAIEICHFMVMMSMMAPGTMIMTIAAMTVTVIVRM